MPCFPEHDEKEISLMEGSEVESQKPCTDSFILLLFVEWMGDVVAGQSGNS